MSPPEKSTTTAQSFVLPIRPTLDSRYDQDHRPIDISSHPGPVSVNNPSSPTFTAINTFPPSDTPLSELRSVISNTESEPQGWKAVEDSIGRKSVFGSPTLIRLFKDHANITAETSANADEINPEIKDDIETDHSQNDVHGTGSSHTLTHRGVHDGHLSATDITQFLKNRSQQRRPRPLKTIKQGRQGPSHAGTTRNLPRIRLSNTSASRQKTPTPAWTSSSRIWSGHTRNTPFPYSVDELD